jgi:hypothetical protein
LVNATHIIATGYEEISYLPVGISVLQVRILS